MNTKIFFVMFIAASFCCDVAFSQSSTDDIQRLLTRAQTAYSMGEYDDALKEYLKIKQMAPNYPDLYKAIGDVYEKLGKDDDLANAIESYKTYLRLAPNAADKEEMNKKIYTLEYIHEKQVQQTKILDDLNGTWIAVDNVEFLKIYEETGENPPYSDFVFNISEVQKTGTYRVTIMRGSINYRETIVEKTVPITPQKDNSFNFTIADAQVHTPNQGGGGLARVGAGILGDVIGGKLGGYVTDAANALIDNKQANDLPSNTSTAYMFALKYVNGKLEGVVNVVRRFADPNQQKTLKNDLYEIIFVKKNDNFDNLNAYSNSYKPERILTGFELFTEGRGINMQGQSLSAMGGIAGIMALSVQNPYGGGYYTASGQKLSQREIINRLTNFNADLGKRYKQARNQYKTGIGIYISGLLIGCSAIGPLVATPKVTTSYNYLTGISYSDNSEQLRALGWSMVGIGGGSFITGICLWAPAYGKTGKIIKEYNNQLTNQKSKPTAELNFGIAPSGFGLAINF